MKEKKQRKILNFNFIEEISFRLGGVQIFDQVSFAFLNWVA